MYWRSGMRSCEAATAIMPSPQRTAPMVNAKAQIQGKTERKGKEGEAHREELLDIHDEEDGSHGREKCAVSPKERAAALNPTSCS